MAVVHPRAAAVLLLALAGCASPEPPAAVTEEPRWVTVDPVVLAEGSFRWHQTGTGLVTALEYYDLASQAIAHPCVWGDGDEVYFNNLHLRTSGQGLGPWSGNLSTTLDWTDEDWLGGALRIAYQAPGLAGWHETQPIERGSTLTVPVRVAQGAAALGEEAQEEAAVAADWSVWVCLPEDGGMPQQPFLGSVQARLVFAPDPVLESELPADGGSGGRQARTG